MSVSDSQSYIALPVQIASGSIPLTKLAVGTQGDITYFNGTNWVVLAAGTSGKFLQTLGVGVNPTWASVSGSRYFRKAATITGGAIAAGAEQTIFDVAPTAFQTNLYRIKARFEQGGSDAFIIYFTVKLYKGANVIWESAILANSATQFIEFSGDYDGTTFRSKERKFTTSPAISLLTSTSTTARDMTVSGNIKMTIKNTDASVRSPNADHQVWLEITEDAS